MQIIYFNLKPTTHANSMTLDPIDNSLPGTNYGLTCLSDDPMITPRSYTPYFESANDIGGLTPGFPYYPATNNNTNFVADYPAQTTVNLFKAGGAQSLERHYWTNDSVFSPTAAFSSLHYRYSAHRWPTEGIAYDAYLGQPYMSFYVNTKWVRAVRFKSASVYGLSLINKTY